MQYENHLSSSGMYSKAGQYTVRRFNQLQLKDQILYNRKKKIKLPNSRLEEELQKQIEQQEKIAEFQKQHKLIYDDEQKQQATDPEDSFLKQRSLSQMQPFQKMIAREFYFRMNQKQIQSPLNIIYNPKYHLVYKKSALYEDNNYEEEKRRRAHSDRQSVERPVLERQRSSVQIESSLLESKVQSELKSSQDHKFKSISLSSSQASLSPGLTSRVKGFVTLEKQTPRPVFRSNYDVNEKRFEVVKESNFVKKRVMGVNFRQFSERSNLFNIYASDLQYHVKLDQILPKQDKCVPNFKFILSRKQQLPPVYTLDEQFYSQ